MKRYPHAEGKVCVYSSISCSGKTRITLTAYSWSRAANLLLKRRADRLIHSENSAIKQAVFPQDSVDKQLTQSCLNPLLAKAMTKLTSHSFMELQCLLSFPVRVHCTVMWGFNNLTHHQTNQFFYVQVKIIMPITERE